MVGTRPIGLNRAWKRVSEVFIACGLALVVGCDAEAPMPTEPDLAASPVAAPPGVEPADDVDEALLANELSPPVQLVKLEWMEVATSDSEETGLESAGATIRVMNISDQPMAIALDLSGHRGTTRTLRADLSTLELSAGAAAEVPVDLEPYLEGDSPFSRAVVVGASGESAENGEAITATVGPALFFHELPTGEVVAYNDRVLVDRFRGGDPTDSTEYELQSLK